MTNSPFKYVNFIQSKYFPLENFKCPCEKCKNKEFTWEYLDPKLIQKLDALKELTSYNLVITSGYRCEEHNTQIGGEWKSAHTRGQAVDLTIQPYTDFSALRYLFMLAEQVKFHGIGIYPHKRIIHCDVSNRFQRWRQNRQGVYIYLFVDE